jgi:hypothetical protein
VRVRQAWSRACDSKGSTPAPEALAGQLRVVRAAGLKIGAHAEDDQGRGFVVRPVPDGGRGVQRGDERAPLLLCQPGYPDGELIERRPGRGEQQARPGSSEALTLAPRLT